MASPHLLRIPKAAQRAFVDLAGLSSETLEALETALGNARPRLQPSELATWVAKSIEGDEEQIERIVYALAGLYVARAQKCLGVEEFVESIYRSATLTEDSLEITDENWNVLRERLTKLLQFDQSIGITSKAIDVLFHNEHTFCASRIVTDIRPVFSDETEEPAGYVTVHNLKLSYHIGSDLKDFFIALDGRDLSQLKEVIDRAERKTTRLQQALAATNLADLETETE